MASHCSLRAGGMAQDFFMPESIQALAQFLQSNTKPVLLVGLGSNLLVRDSGFDGVVIKLTQLKSLHISQTHITAEAGVTLAKLSRFAQEKNLYGSEFLSAIPGTIGGALAMNAGAFGSEFWQFVKCVNTMNTSGEVFQRQPADFDISYRQATPAHPHEFFISVELVFNQKPSNQNIQQLLQKRNNTQPIGLPSCGSVFKNPAKHYAAELIEKSQLKGFCIGGACVSDKHANFIINRHHASAADIENLILHIQQTVKSNFKIDLETELKII
ncbi:UDP-N-acetylmuramate dehydrogenase [Candidatus Thioglobus autotrophicus]|uniref:UDP-N-acetylmuramate dehydrogenase n=1 Tax=Candidatus Thioglobus autotrophicus TaxID=1705394 RepID=UPI00299DE1B2|nr:UDP-N-acetylmuramate dehydrogenase [Candidatus Thioglobus autotrophicus]WPE16909.1 UDP-N-acetylmuramate dehydrogenase [Candidatus Thioglobus autotrophicus]